MKHATTMNVVLQEAFKTNFSVFDGYDEAVKKAQIAKFGYIETIAFQLEKNLADVNLFEIFPNNNNIITAGENEINQVLIDFNREAYFNKPDEPHKIIEMTEEQLEAVKKSFNTQFASRKRNVTDSINSHIREAQNRMRAYHENMQHAAIKRRELETMTEGDATPLIESMKKLFTDPRFTFHKFSGYNHTNDTVEFITTNNIINTHENSRAGINLRVDLGKYLIKLRLDGMRTFIYKYEENLVCDGNIHPHVSGDNNICLGNMGEIYQEAAMKCDVHGIFDAVMAVLLNYNDGDPYRSLARFSELQERNMRTAKRKAERAANGGAPSSDRRYQHVDCPECDESHEVAFLCEEDGDYMEDECPECDTMTEYEYDYEQ